MTHGSIVKNLPMLLANASKRAVLGLLFLILAGASFLAVGSDDARADVAFTREEISLLAKEAKGNGWSAKDIEALLKNKKTRKITDLVELNVTQPIILSHSRYKHYTHAESVEKARRFSMKWNNQLEKASKRYKVDREVIVGILLVETNLGLYKGDHQLLSVFSSIFVDSARLLKDGKFKKDKGMKARLEKKKAWALGEFKALLQMGKRFNFDLYKLKGSYAGAFGLPQFLPSSYVKWAVSSTSKTRANLFWEPDAIHSVANFLNAHGYKLGAAKKQRKKAVWFYNHSDVYVDTVFSVAHYVKKQETLAARE